MSDVEFPEEQEFIKSASWRRDTGTKRPNGLLGLVIRTGLAKDETGAMIILVACGVIALILAVLILFVAR